MNASRKLKIPSGNGRWMYHGIFAFTTTGATKDVDIPFGRVESVAVLAIGAPAADEVLSVDETVSGTAGGSDAAIVGSNAQTTLTVTRTGASKTSGLKFSIIVFGY